MVRPMKNTTENGVADKPYPSMLRCKVIGDNQLQLPRRLVREVGYESSRVERTQNAKVAWYYHAGDQKAVLADKSVDRPSLELKGESTISGVRNEALNSEGLSSGRVTIIKTLPNSLYDRLTQDSLVLRPLYADQHETLEATCVSVYPAGEYDHGELPNVDHSQIPGDEDKTSSDEPPNVVGTYDGHMNSV